uniref:Uncharacterized protein n=1 Tax=Anguilla anguilla TaxID=7936 RepID=A0A0E9TDU9_ANGAN
MPSIPSCEVSTSQNARSCGNFPISLLFGHHVQSTLTRNTT